MSYLEITIKHTLSEDLTDLLTAELGNVGFESFVDNDNCLLAYIPQDNFNEQLLHAIVNDFYDHKLEYNIVQIKDQNWNAIWESSYSPVKFGTFCNIRAPFHEKATDVKFDLIIEPKMSFGTAHHETTALMIKWIEETEFADKIVLDMGCGTGVLAILAEKCGAKNVTAIDIDEWSYENTLENIEKNNCSAITAQLGDAKLLTSKIFQIILANINRNILLNDIPVYAHSLQQGGILFLSGFFKEDIPAIAQRCAEFNINLQETKEKNNWAALKMLKL